jgi:hypothetical protein
MRTVRNYITPLVVTGAATSMSMYVNLDASATHCHILSISKSTTPLRPLSPRASASTGRSSTTTAAIVNRSLLERAARPCRLARGGGVHRDQEEQIWTRRNGLTP